MSDSPTPGLRPVRSIDPKSLPKHFDAVDVEARWDASWQDAGVYHYDPERPREETFVVDTPPPTASGSLHIGHVFSYTQADVVVRYQRMRGMNIFYPMGWDDNGLPTERRVAGMCAVFALTQVVAATAPAGQSITATSLLSAGGCFVGAAAAAGLPPSAFSLRDTAEMRAPKAREAEGLAAV